MIYLRSTRASSRCAIWAGSPSAISRDCTAWAPRRSLCWPGRWPRRDLRFCLRRRAAADRRHAAARATSTRGLDYGGASHGVDGPPNLPGALSSKSATRDAPIAGYAPRTLTSNGPPGSAQHPDLYGWIGQLNWGVQSRTASPPDGGPWHGRVVDAPNLIPPKISVGNVAVVAAVDTPSRSSPASENTPTDRVSPGPFDCSRFDTRMRSPIRWGCGTGR